jgi:glycosyltransferase involved in cell wall biosynthesis
MNESRRYVLISPARNEAAFAQLTIDCVVNQTVRPALWVIVDDGSDDATPTIVDQAAKQHDFIKVIHRPDRGRRSIGPGVIDAFAAGLEQVDLSQFDYLCKCDLDLILPHDYFEQLIERMEANPRLGTCSGKAYYRDEHGRMISEGIGDDVSVGASKFYRVECFKQIGGFVHEVMWDGIDCHRCRMLGWVACSWDDKSLRFTHLRPMGSSERGIMTGRKRHGYGQYYMGTSLWYMTASAMYRSFTSRPWITGGLAMWWGFVASMLKRKPRYEDKAFRRFLRRYQLQCLLHGKGKAMRCVERKQAAQWNGIGATMEKSA